MSFETINAMLRATEDDVPEWDVRPMGEETKKAGPKPAESGVIHPPSKIKPRILVDAYLQDKGIEFKIEQSAEVTKYVIECPFDPDDCPTDDSSFGRSTGLTALARMSVAWK